MKSVLAYTLGPLCLEHWQMLMAFMKDYNKTVLDKKKYKKRFPLQMNSHGINQHH